MKHFYILALLILVNIGAKAQLVINEFSQGKDGEKEFIEFVVVGTPTCMDSTVDLRGWIFDDNTKEWYGDGGAAQGFLKFRNVANWANVPYGSIILVYNSQDKNTSITLADDPTDANNDKVYILSANSNLFESGSGSNYTGTTTTNSGNSNWTKLGLRNGGDAVVTVSPTNRNAAFHSISYGSNNQRQARNADIKMPTSGGGKNYFLNDSLYTNQASWLDGAAPLNETPGAPNSPANAAWINSLRMPATTNNLVKHDTFDICQNALPFLWKGQSIVRIGDSVATASNGICDTTFILTLRATLADTVHITQRICNTQLPYTWNGQIINTLGTHTLSHRSLSIFGGCDSVTILNLTVNPAKTGQSTVNLCQQDLPFTWNNQTVNTIGTSTLQHTFTSRDGCDSVVTMTVNVHPQSNTTIAAQICYQDLPYIFNNTPYHATGSYTVTLQNSNGCDSVINLDLQVSPAPIDSSITLRSCDSVLYNNVWYKSTTNIGDTVFNAQGCAVRYNDVNIIIYEGFKQYDTVTVCEIDGYEFHGRMLNRTGFYTAAYKNALGCDSNYYLQLYATPKPVLHTAIDPLVVACVGDTFYIHYAGADSLGWLPEPDYLYDSRAGFVLQDGNNVFTLKGSNGGKCVSEKVIDLNAENCCEIGIPNAFSPNGDGLNDYFKIITPGNPKHFSLMIYDRYGTKVFMAHNPDITWDGTYNGKMVNMGVYYFILETECNGKQQIKKGDITIIQ